jgi:hypothetical protein
MATYSVTVRSNGLLTVRGRMKQGEEWLTFEAKDIPTRDEAMRAVGAMATEFANIRGETRKGWHQLHLPTMEAS